MLPKERTAVHKQHNARLYTCRSYTKPKAYISLSNLSRVLAHIHQNNNTRHYNLVKYHDWELQFREMKGFLEAVCDLMYFACKLVTPSWYSLWRCCSSCIESWDTVVHVTSLLPYLLIRHRVSFCYWALLLSVCHFHNLKSVTFLWIMGPGISER